MTENNRAQEVGSPAAATVQPTYFVQTNPHPKGLLKEIVALAVGAALGLTIVGAPVFAILGGAVVTPVVFEIIKHAFVKA